MAQTVGVSAVFDTKQFNAGLQTYVNGMNIAQNVTVNVTKDERSQLGVFGWAGGVNRHGCDQRAQRHRAGCTEFGQ